MKPDDWNAATYTQHSNLQQAMAEEVLSLLVLSGHERVLDIGCGDGRLSARIADRVRGGSVLGVDASADMIAFATEHFARDGAQPHANLRFEVADARTLAYGPEFDLLVSFNALHWVPEQTAALQGVAAAMRPEGRAMLRLVTKGAITSLEEVAEAVRQLPGWAPWFAGFTDPYLRLTSDEYAALATAHGLRVLSLNTHAREWDFKTGEAFFGFCRAGFGAWTLRLPEDRRDAFVDDVMDAYRAATARGSERAHVFGFYQMDITLAHVASEG